MAVPQIPLEALEPQYFWLQCGYKETGHVIEAETGGSPRLAGHSLPKLFG